MSPPRKVRPRRPKPQLERYGTALTERTKRQLMTLASELGVPAWQIAEEALRLQWRSLPPAVREAAETIAAVSAGGLEDRGGRS